MLFTVLFAICLPAFVAVAGAVWYHRLQWEQHYAMKAVIEAEAVAEANIDDEDDVHLGKEASKDRRPRNVLLVDVESLGTNSGLWKIERALDYEHGQEMLLHGEYDIVVLPLTDESGTFLNGRLPIPLQCAAQYSVTTNHLRKCFHELQMLISCARLTTLCDSRANDSRDGARRSKHRSSPFPTFWQPRESTCTSRYVRAGAEGAHESQLLLRPRQ